MNTKHKITFYINIVLTIAIMVIIFLFSTESGEISANTSGSFKDTLLNLLSPILPDMIIGFLDKYIRQIAHFTLYFAMGLTTTFAIREWLYLYRPEKKITLRAYATALAICVIYSISDELHQYFVPGRSCRIIDIAIDTAGALISISLIYVISIIYSRRKKPT